ncbi:MAG: hypothetical protein EXQ59_04570 [Acidobacteria bacterium]|nr:hypothetical protein [Acidobacteriota bacterium]
MNRQKFALLVLAGVVILAAAASADQAARGAARPNDEPAAGQAPAAPRRLVSAVRGDAPMVYLSPTVKAAKIGGKDFIVTTMQVKNVATGAIAGLLVEEFWYNKAGTVVTGDNYRHPKPIQPNEIITVTLETPRNAGMDSNQLKFQHANGGLTMTKVAKF